MIIDCHTHLGRNEHINANVSELLDSMDAAHIDQALVFAGMLNNISTEELLKEIAPHRDRLHAVAAFDADYHSFDNVYLQRQLPDLYGEGKIAAVKFYTGYDHYYPSDAKNILHYLDRVGCPAIFHMGDCLNSVKRAKIKYAQPITIDEVAVDYPNMNFIIAHMGFPWVRDSAEVCYKNANVFSDFSGFVYKTFDKDSIVKFQKNVREFLEIADSDKLLFGTDWPIASQGSYIDAVDWLSTHTTNSLEAKILTPTQLSLNVKKAFKL